MALAYTSSIDIDGSLSSNIVVSYLVAPAYIFVDDTQLSSNDTTSYVVVSAYSSIDDTTFLSSNITGIKNQTYAYIQGIETGSFLSSNIVGIKNALPVYMDFRAIFPYSRLNVSSNAPFLKQVFTE